MPHTPGDWTASDPVQLTDQAGLVRILAPGFPPIGNALWSANPSIPKEMAIANARLIAAAPDLLAALEWALPLLSKASDAGVPINEAKYLTARAAISRAKEGA